MMPCYGKLVRLLGDAAVIFLGGTSIAAQIEPKGPVELIRYLTYQADRPDKHGMVKGYSVVFSCGHSLGEDRDNRALTNALVNFGTSAVPALEDALDSFEARGNRSEVAPEAGWLLLAYARLKGPVAYSRLHRMYGNPGLASYSYELDAALALAFGFTSYLSTLRASQTFHKCVEADGSTTLSQMPCAAPEQEQPVRSFRCNRGNEPRDSLNRLISAWQVGNRSSVEASLGPGAATALRTTLVGRNWESLRRELRSGVSGRNTAIGYRFNVSGRWAEPDEMLKEERERTNLAGGASRFDLETQFYDSAGNGCGRRTLSFLAVPEQGWHNDGNPPLPVLGPIEYRIDNSDITDLLRLIFACTATDQVP